jgi:Fur family ferric uptake transcriptional regulator
MGAALRLGHATRIVMNHKNEDHKTEQSQDWQKIRSEFEAYLSRCGQRYTKQRETILKAVFLAGTHTDAEGVLKQAKKLDPTIGFATVYRSLQLMLSGGILAERSFGGDRRKFEIVGGDSGHHDHLICLDCGAVLEFFDPEVEEMQERIAKKLGFALTGHRMDLFGHCVRGENCPRRGKHKHQRETKENE